MSYYVCFLVIVITLVFGFLAFPVNMIQSRFYVVVFFNLEVQLRISIKIC